MMDDANLEELSETERLMVILYRQLKEDHLLIRQQAEEGMLHGNPMGALAMTQRALSHYMTNVTRYMMADLTGRTLD